MREHDPPERFFDGGSHGLPSLGGGDVRYDRSRRRPELGCKLREKLAAAAAEQDARRSVCKGPSARAADPSGRADDDARAGGFHELASPSTQATTAVGPATPSASAVAAPTSSASRSRDSDPKTKGLPVLAWPPSEVK